MTSEQENSEKLNEECEKVYNKSLDSWTEFGIAGDEHLKECEQEARKEMSIKARQQGAEAERKRIIEKGNEYANRVLNCHPREDFVKYGAEETWKIQMETASKILISFLKFIVNELKSEAK